MNAPLVTFCVPTYNRSRYLDSLLSCLTAQLAGFPYSYEIFVSDNASTDNTSDVVAAYNERLPLRYVRHETNRGGRANWQYMMSHAHGTYVIYVADDDALLGDRVAHAIALMQGCPQIGVVYAPWKLYDLVADREEGQFYRQDRDVVVPQGHYAELLDTLLRYHIFPDICIYRRELLISVMPRIHEQAYYAFVQSAEFVERCAVLFMKEPFYVSITRYFADHQRSQGGNEEAEVAWDRYRAGLEYILGRAQNQVDDAQRIEFCLRIQRMIADRIAVAVRLRHHAARDPVETYYLAYRLKALGMEQLLPLPMQDIRSLAAMGFLVADPELNRDVTQLICVGQFEPEFRNFLESKSSLPVSYVAEPAALPRLDNAVVFARAGVDIEDLVVGENVRVVGERALLQKFPA